MADKTDLPFHYDTGLPEGPGTFTNVRFTRDPEVNEGQTLLLKSDIMFDDPDVGEYLSLIHI